MPDISIYHEPSYTDELIDYVQQYGRRMNVKRPSLFDIIALEPSVVYALDIEEHAHFLTRRIEGQEYVRPFVEALAFNHLQKAVSLACCSPWECLKELQQRIPNVFQRINMKDIAAYIGVSPETLSRHLAAFHLP